MSRSALGYDKASVTGSDGIDGVEALVQGEVHIFENPVKIGTPAMCSTVPPGFKSVTYPGAAGTGAVGNANPGPAPICMDCWREAGWRP